MIAVDAALAYYLDQVECLRAVERAARAGTFASTRFANQTAQQVGVRLAELRNELERQVVLVLVASAEGALRRDLEARIQPAGAIVGWRRVAFRLHLPKQLWEKIGTLEDRLTNLRVRHGNRIPLEKLLDVWTKAGADKHVVGQFKRLLKQRHWLAHGRYFRDPSGLGTPPDPASAHAVVDAMFRQLAGLRPGFPLP